MGILSAKAKKLNSNLLLGMALGVGFLGTAGAMSPVETHAATEKKAEAPKEASTGGIGGLTIDAKGNIKGTNGFDTTSDKAGAWTNFIEKYRFFIAGISGVAAISMILFFVLNFMKLGATSGNPGERSKAIGGLVWTGLAAAGLGGVSILVGFFYNAFI